MTESARGILFSSLVDQRNALAQGQVTSVELTKSYIARIQKLDGDLNIVIRKNFSNALARAQELDEIQASKKVPLGHLHGVPFTIKDAFRIKNVFTSYGFPGFNLVPAFDSCTVVERLKDAGAVFLGQTNVPLSCFDWQTNSPIYGLTRNPLDPTKTVGGSSGGSAASVAAFFTPFEVGSDVAGSIRYPAHCCGVFGLRPTHNFVRFDDIGPNLHKKSFSNLAVAGPITRSIKDMELVLQVVTNTTPVSQTPKKLKIAYTLSWSGIRADERSEASILKFIEKVRSAGHDVILVDPEIDFDECLNALGIILGYEYKMMIPPPFKYRPLIDIFNYFFNSRRFQSGPFKDAFQEGLLAEKTKYESALKNGEALREVYHQTFQDYDLWLTPVSASAAITHQKTGMLQSLRGAAVDYATYLGGFLTSTALLHHPILSAPIETDDSGHPIGVQLHGKSGKDWQLLSDCSRLNDFFYRISPDALPPLATSDEIERP
jgi:amidase